MRSLMSSVSKTVQSRTIIVFAAILLIAVGVALGADFWEKKEYKQWNDKECAKILKDSPWAYTHVLMGQGSIGQKEGEGGQPNIEYQITLASALPIRQAKVRQLQLVNKYDSLPPEKQQEMDKQTAGFINAEYDKVLVTVTYATNMQNLELEMAHAWQTKTLASFQNQTYLISSSGVKVPVEDFKVAQGATPVFQFIFPRTYQGKPLLTEQDKSLTLEFYYPIVNRMGSGKDMIEFKVKKMMFGGALVY